ncbi:twin-arginine translocation signal domain-containing protein [Mesorhizobium sp. M1329]
MQIIQTRRRFLAGAAMVGAAGIVGLPQPLHAEPPLWQEQRNAVAKS